VKSGTKRAKPTTNQKWIKGAQKDSNGVAPRRWSRLKKQARRARACEFEAFAQPRKKSKCSKAIDGDGKRKVVIGN